MFWTTQVRQRISLQPLEDPIIIDPQDRRELRGSLLQRHDLPHPGTDRNLFQGNSYFFKIAIIDGSTGIAAGIQ